MEERVRWCDYCKENGERVEAVDRLIGKSRRYIDVCAEHLPATRLQSRRPKNGNGKVEKPRRRLHRCPECGEGMPTARGVKIHMALKHGVHAKEEEAA